MSEAVLGTPPPAPAPAGAPPAADSSAATPSAASGTPAAVDAAKDALEAAGGDVPDKKKGESAEDYELRLSKATRELRVARAEIEKLKGGNSADRERLKQLEAEMEKAKNKRLSKKEWLEITKGMAAGTLQLDDDEMAALPEGVRKKIEELENWKKTEDQKLQEQQGSAQRKKEEGVVATALKDFAESHPLMSEGHAAFVLDAWYERYIASSADPTQRVKPDLESVVTELHDGLVNTLVSALQSPKARQFLLSKPELKDLLGGQEVSTGGPKSDAQGADRGTGPRSTTNAPSPVTPEPRTAPLTEDERIERSRAAYEEHRRARAGG